MSPLQPDDLLRRDCPQCHRGPMIVHLHPMVGGPSTFICEPCRDEGRPVHMWEAPDKET